MAVHSQSIWQFERGRGLAHPLWARVMFLNIIPLLMSKSITVNKQVFLVVALRMTAPEAVPPDFVVLLRVILDGAVVAGEWAEILPHYIGSLSLFGSHLPHPLAILELQRFQQHAFPLLPLAVIQDQTYLPVPPPHRQFAPVAQGLLPQREGIGRDGTGRLPAVWLRPEAVLYAQQLRILEFQNFPLELLEVGSIGLILCMAGEGVGGEGLRGVGVEGGSESEHESLPGGRLPGVFGGEHVLGELGLAHGYRLLLKLSDQLASSQTVQVLPLKTSRLRLSSRQSLPSSPSTFCRQQMSPLCTVPCWFQKPSAKGGFFWLTYLMQNSPSCRLSIFNQMVRSRTKLIREFQLSASSLYPPKMNTCVSFSGAHPLQLSNPNSPATFSMVGSTSVQVFERMLQTSMPSLFSPLAKTPPNLTSWSLPKEQRQELVVAFLLEAMSLISPVLGQKASHLRTVSSLSVMPPTMQTMPRWERTEWLDLGTASSATDLRVCLAGSYWQMSLLRRRSSRMVPPSTKMLPSSVATVRWKEGIWKSIARGIVCQWAAWLSRSEVMSIRWRVELVTSKKCRNGCVWKKLGWSIRNELCCRIRSALSGGGLTLKLFWQSLVYFSIFYCWRDSCRLPLLVFPLSALPVFSPLLSPLLPVFSLFLTPTSSFRLFRSISLFWLFISSFTLTLISSSTSSTRELKCRSMVLQFSLFALVMARTVS